MWLLLFWVIRSGIGNNWFGVPFEEKSWIMQSSSVTRHGIRKRVILLRTQILPTNIWYSSADIMNILFQESDTRPLKVTKLHDIWSAMRDTILCQNYASGWLHDIETLSTSRALCEGNPLVNRPHRRLAMRKTFACYDSEWNLSNLNLV